MKKKSEISFSRISHFESSPIFNAFQAATQTPFSYTANLSILQNVSVLSIKILKKLTLQVQANFQFHPIRNKVLFGYQQ
jgi:hypothetical protein